MWRIGLMILALGVMVGADGPSKDATKDKDALRGTWTMVSFVVSGERVPDDEVKTGAVIFEGDEFRPKFGANAARAKITIDASKNPKAIDFKFTTGPQKGRTSLGIYELDGDTFRLYRAVAGRPRPKAFASEPGTGTTLMSYRRDKVNMAAVEAELKRFEGIWRFESLIVEGREMPPGGLKASRLTLKGDTFEMTDPLATYRGTFRLDPSATPKTIDMAFTEGPEAGKTSLGIYELKGDAYKLCVGLAGKARPSEFASKPGSGHALEVLNRQKP